MLFSEYFHIADSVEQDWFDPILDADTRLFVDPFLIFKEKNGSWANAHQRIIQHFDRVFTLVARSSGEQSLSYRKALHLLTFREPHELCLGYTATGTRGAGSGHGYARSIAEAITDAIRRGLEHPRHFEELGVLNEGIGPDRISDITCTILKQSLVQYTQEVAARYGIPADPHQVYAAGFDEQRLRWVNETVDVPTNPIKGGPLLLIPRRFLRDLPTLNAYDWWNYYEYKLLRDDVNYEILGRLDKRSIITIARSNPDIVREWSQERETRSGESYDFANDPLGVWKWDETTRAYVKSNPLVISAAVDEREFAAVVELVIRQYALFIEDQGGWSLLWAGPGREKPEQAAQLVFRGIAQSYCRANNISLDAEVNLGRGPVDFKFSNGYSRRAHLEVKKLHNGAFWNGLEKQLPSYMRSDEVNDGWFVAIRYRSGEAAENRARELPSRVNAVAKARSLNLRYALLDARPPLSASKL